MGRKEENIKKAQTIMLKPKFIRNIGTAAHIDHGKTTLSDNLIAGAGMMSEQLAGKQLLLDYDEQEQERGITINSANASMVHEFKGNEYLINLIDTPGHVDFGGDVTRAMRAIDGCIILACAVEGVMPQTETVIRQAIKEKVVPLLFINKVDRLINELKVTPEQMQQRFVKIIAEVNKQIKRLAPADFKEAWNLDVEGGRVGFGSAYHNWAISVPYMKKSNISFKDIYDHCANDDQKNLAKKSPVHEVLLDMVIEHLPDPLTAQKYRIPDIWHGENDSNVGQAMIKCDPNGPPMFMVTKVIIDPHAGEIATGRLFSGKIKQGDEMYISGMPNRNRVQRVSLFVGPDRITVDSAEAGNVVAVAGLKDAISGSTVSNNQEMVPFEQIKHVSEPVVTVAIEAKNTKDLPKLVEVLRMVAKADPSIVVAINSETGEHLMSGMGELHLEITQYRIEKEYGVPINASPPIVVYRETVNKASPATFEGKSPNKHNRFYCIAEPMDPKIQEALRDGTIDVDDKRIKDKKKLETTLRELGMDKDLAKGVYAIKGQNMLVNATKGIQYLFETKELLVEAFNEAMELGPRGREPCMGVMVRLMDAKLHEDSIHRGPAQIIPAMRSSVYGAMVTAGTVILEPKVKVFVNTPMEQVGNVTRELQQRRSIVEDITQDEDISIIVAKAPVAEMFGFASAIRSATQGRALWSTEFSGFDKLPGDQLNQITTQIRTRKGLKPEPPTADYYSA